MSHKLRCQLNNMASFQICKPTNDFKINFLMICTPINPDTITCTFWHLSCQSKDYLYKNHFNYSYNVKKQNTTSLI